MPVRIGDVTVFLGPEEQGGPDSLLEPILAFIARAGSRQNLMIAVQEIDHPEIAKAIVEARLRGANIDLVVEQDYLRGGRRPKTLEEAFAPGGKHEVNRMLFNAILRSTADVKLDYNASIFHQKFMTLGDAVLTGSTNFTETGVKKNLNHIVVVENAKVAKSYRDEFREIRRGNFGKLSVAHGAAPITATVSGMRVKPLFAPDHAPEMEIMKQIAKAKERVDFAIFTFAKSSGIDDALTVIHRTGVKVRGVLDLRQANQKWAAKVPLEEAGVDIRLASGPGLGKLHHKLMTIDDQLSIFGSFNYTGPANKLNDENILIVGDLEETDPEAKRKQGEIALAARREIDRIYDVFGS